MSDSGTKQGNHVRDVADAMHIRVFTLSALRLDVNQWNARNVQSSYWRIYQNANDGAVLNLASGVQYPLYARRVYFVPAGVRFGCGDDGRAFKHFYVHFDVIGLPRLLMRALFDGPVACAPNIDFETRVFAFAQCLAHDSERSLSYQCRAKSLIYEGLARCLDEADTERLSLGLRRAELLEPVASALRYIDAYPADELTVPLLAGLCCQSPDHFARRFKQCVGQTPGVYIREKRVTLAAQRLLFTQDSLDMIAQDCGFGNRNYLTRVFTRAVGIAPAAYRHSRRV